MDFLTFLSKFGITVFQRFVIDGTFSDVLFKKESTVKGQRTNDIVADGRDWEIKKVDSDKVKKLRKRISKADGQSNKVVLDLSDSAIDRDIAFISIAEMMSREDFEEIIVIHQGEVFPFKQKSAGAVPGL